MIRFFLKRYVRAVAARRLWLLLTLVPLIIYLVSSAIVPDRFIVKQEISISKDTPISLSPRPADLRPLSQLASTPNDFFLNRFALILLEKHLDMDIQTESSQNPEATLKRIVARCLSLTTTANNVAVIVYKGGDPRLGQAIISFYSQRLIEQAGARFTRNKFQVMKDLPTPKLIGEMAVEEQRSLWRSERLLPAVYIFAISLVVLLVLIALIDWLKPSFRSERHVARYLKVPILGSLPDFKHISEVMKSFPSRE